MTTEEIFNNYKKVFILAMELAGDKSENSSYKNVESILNGFKDLEKILIEEDAPLKAYISYLEYLILLDIYKMEKLNNLGVEDIYVLINDMFSRYLKTFTRKFTNTNGLPPINQLDIIVVIKLGKIDILSK